MLTINHFTMNTTFAILRQDDNQENRFYFQGNGFFIDNDGTFVTAGHVFRNNHNFFICLRENETDDYTLYPVLNYKIKYKLDYYKSEDYRNSVKRNIRLYQYGPEYKDVGVGKVNLSNTSFLTFKKKRPFPYHQLKCIYFKRSTSFLKHGIELSTNALANNYLTKEEVNFIIDNDRFELAEIPRYGGTNKTIDHYNNCMHSYASLEQGNSGAPVLLGGNVVGIIIGGKSGLKYQKDYITFILSRYVSKISRRLRKSI